MTWTRLQSPQSQCVDSPSLVITFIRRRRRRRQLLLVHRY